MRRRMRWGRGVAVCMREAGACGTGGHGLETVRAKALARLRIRMINETGVPRGLDEERHVQVEDPLALELTPICQAGF